MNIVLGAQFIFFSLTTEHKGWQLMGEEMEASLVMVMDSPARITLEEVVVVG